MQWKQWKRKTKWLEDRVLQKIVYTHNPTMYTHMHTHTLTLPTTSWILPYSMRFMKPLCKDAFRFSSNLFWLVGRGAGAEILAVCDGAICGAPDACDVGGAICGAPDACNVGGGKSACVIVDTAISDSSGWEDAVAMGCCGSDVNNVLLFALWLFGTLLLFSVEVPGGGWISSISSQSSSRSSYSSTCEPVSTFSFYLPFPSSWMNCDPSSKQQHDAYFCSLSLSLLKYAKCALESLESGSPNYQTKIRIKKWSNMAMVPVVKNRPSGFGQSPAVDNSTLESISSAEDRPVL